MCRDVPLEIRPTLRFKIAKPTRRGFAWWRLLVEGEFEGHMIYNIGGGLKWIATVGAVGAVGGARMGAAVG